MIDQPPGFSRSPDVFQTTLRDIGLLQVLIGGLFLFPLLVSLLYREWYTALSFLIAGGITVPLGWLVYKLCQEAPEPKRYHAMIVAAGGWLVTVFFGALPFLIVAYITPETVLESLVPAGAEYQSSLLYFRNPLHALFESMSAYTTTGLTMSIHEPSIGHGMLFYRSFAQWIGGAGMIVLSLAILRQPYGSAGISLYKSEAKNKKIRPSIVGTARAIWKVYLAITAIMTTYLVVATLYVMPDYGLENTLFDAINHAMTGQSTGGFSTLDDSIAGYGSQLMEIVYLVPMISGAIAIPVYYAVLFKGEIKQFVRDTQIRMMFAFFAVGVIVLSAFLTGFSGISFSGGFIDYVIQFFASEAFRQGSFQYISALTTTGWQTAPIGDWNGSSVLFIVWGGMLIGGSAGATVGAIKIMRVYVIGRGIQWEVSRLFMPKHGVNNLRIGEKTLSEPEANDEIRAATTFTLAYLIILGCSLFILLSVMGPDFTLADAIFEVASAQGTIGLSSGITGPDMPAIAEILFMIQMWMGRLEIIPVLVFINSFFRR